MAVKKTESTFFGYSFSTVLVDDDGCCVIGGGPRAVLREAGVLPGAAVLE
jgi:hypothetical protein